MTSQASLHKASERKRERVRACVRACVRGSERASVREGDGRATGGRREGDGRATGGRREGDEGATGGREGGRDRKRRAMGGWGSIRGILGDFLGAVHLKGCALSHTPAGARPMEMKLKGVRRLIDR
jgi:hypothetical protein